MPAFTNILTSSCINTVLLKYLELKVVVEWLTLLLRTREILGPNLGPETGYPGFPQSLQANAGIVP
jgi:hypothetical protein